MQIIKTYKLKLNLNNNQKYLINQMIGCCRYLYNYSLQYKQDIYEVAKINLSEYDIQKELTTWKNIDTFLKIVPSQSLQDVISRMDKAYKTFFRGGGFPKWAKKDIYNSIKFKSINKVSNNRFILPKIGEVKTFKDRNVLGKLKNATIVKESKGYFICIVVEQEKEVINTNKSQVGIDMGVSFFATLSNGVYINNPRHYLCLERKLRIENRSLARKIKGSNSWIKQKKKLSNLHNKIANTRKDFLHKISSNIIKEFGTIIVEDLKVKNMVKFGHLSKHISDCGWSMFFDMLKYKSEWNGNIFMKIDPKYTSQTCNECGSVDSKSRISQSKFICTNCGCEINADVNASKNILGKGIAFIREREAVACA